MVKSFKEVEQIDLVCEGMYQDLEITEAEYQGKANNVTPAVCST